MSNFTSKVKGVVDKATSAAKDMARETTDMKDKEPRDEGQDEIAPSQVTHDPRPDDEHHVHHTEFGMSSQSQEPHVRWGISNSLER